MQLIRLLKFWFDKLSCYDLEQLAQQLMAAYYEHKANIFITLI